jgi:hypothetical protein
MEHKHSSNEFEALIDDDGKIAIPTELAKRFVGKKIHVRVQNKEISAGLKERNVTEEEVERIAHVQRESRERTTKFLMSEGVLDKDTAFIGRARGVNR